MIFIFIFWCKTKQNDHFEVEWWILFVSFPKSHKLASIQKVIHKSENKNKNTGITRKVWVLFYLFININDSLNYKEIEVSHAHTIEMSWNFKLKTTNLQVNTFFNWAIPLWRKVRILNPNRRVFWSFTHAHYQDIIEF